MQLAGTKRKAEQSTALVAAKKQKKSDGSIVLREGGSNAIVSSGIRRTSHLEAPIMQLGNHDVSDQLLALQHSRSNNSKSNIFRVKFIQ